MDQLKFQVKSTSGDDVYHLSAYRTEAGVRFSCTCPAGENGTYCRHRLGLLVGEVTGVVDPSSEMVQSLISMVSGSPIAAALAQVEAAERVVAQAQRELKSAKKMLARAMMG